MFKEILNIIPRLSNSDLNKMERSLGSRFAKIAKQFGKGLKSAFKGGGIAAIGLSLVDKLLNPLQEVQESIERTLSASDDIVTNANQFGTTAGKLAKLQAFAQSAGLDAGSLNTLIAKFQSAVAEAAVDPSKPSEVRQFVGDKDTAESFFQFIQSLRAETDKDKQVAIQNSVFGEKQLLKASDFLNSDFAALSKTFAKFDTEKLTTDITKLGNLKDLEDTLGAVLGLEDLQNKSKVINENTITTRDRQQREIKRREDERIAQFQTLSTISEATIKLQSLVENGLVQLTNLVTKVTGIADFIKNVKPSKILRGIFGGGD